MKLMIVDDAYFMRATIKKMLQKHGYEVICEAVDGQDAVDKFITYEPDIITMDITMPNMSGIDALKKIKDINSGVKVIMVSAMGQEPLIKEAVINGADSFIIKPFKDDNLISTIEVLYNKGENLVEQVIY